MALNKVGVPAWPAARPPAPACKLLCPVTPHLPPDPLLGRLPGLASLLSLMSLVSHHWPVHLPFPRKLRGPPKLHKLLRSLIRFSPTLSQTTSPCRRLGLNLDLQVDIPNPAPEAHIYTCLPVATPRALRLPLSSVPSSKSTHTPPGPPSLRDSVALQSQGRPPGAIPAPYRPSPISPPMHPSCLTLLHRSHLCPHSYNSGLILSPHPLTLPSPLRGPATPSGPPVPQPQLQALSCLVSSTPTPSMPCPG